MQFGHVLNSNQMSRSPMKAFAFGLAIFMSLLMTTADGAGRVAEPATQDLEVLHQKVIEFLVDQSRGMPGQSTVSVTPIDPRLKLAPCNSIEAFFTGGNRAWGRTTVGLRCNDMPRWSIYVQGNVSVFGQYLVAATSMSQGQLISRSNLAYQTGDLTTLPPGVYSDASQVVGRVTRIAMNAGAVLRQDLSELPMLVRQGQTVRIISAGNGFTISTDGLAQNNAPQGQLVQAKVSSGQLVSGITNANGQIEVQAQ